MADIAKNEQFEAILRNKAVDIVPESLQTIFENEAEELILSARRQIELKQRITTAQATDLHLQSEITLRNWVNEKLRCFGYHRYKKLMEEVGREPRGFAHFSKGARDTWDRPIYALFNYIEKHGILIGSEVVVIRDPVKVFTVIAIHKDCTIHVREKDGSQEHKMQSPFYWRPVDNQS